MPANFLYAIIGNTFFFSGNYWKSCEEKKKKTMRSFLAKLLKLGDHMEECACNIIKYRLRWIDAGKESVLGTHRPNPTSV